MNLHQARAEYNGYIGMQQEGVTPLSFVDWQLKFKKYPIIN